MPTSCQVKISPMSFYPWLKQGLILPFYEICCHFIGLRLAYRNGYTNGQTGYIHFFSSPLVPQRCAYGSKMRKRSNFIFLANFDNLNAFKDLNYYYENFVAVRPQNNVFQRHSSIKFKKARDLVLFVYVTSSNLKMTVKSLFLV